MQVRDAKAVVPGNEAPATQRVGRFEQVRNDTFRDFVQRPNDSFDSDDKVAILKLTLALIDTKILTQLKFPAFGNRVTALEELAQRQDINLRTTNGYEDRAQKFAMDVVDGMRSWTDKELDYALTAANMSGTEFSVSMYEDRLHLWVKEHSIEQLLKESPLTETILSGHAGGSQIGFHALLKECQEPPLELILKKPLRNEPRPPHIDYTQIEKTYGEIKDWAAISAWLEKMGYSGGIGSELLKNAIGGGAELSFSMHPHEPHSPPADSKVFLDLGTPATGKSASIETWLAYIRALATHRRFSKLTFGRTGGTIGSKPLDKFQTISQAGLPGSGDSSLAAFALTELNEPKKTNPTD